MPGTFRWGNVKLKNVGIRYKGNSSSRRSNGTSAVFSSRSTSLKKAHASSGCAASLWTTVSIRQPFSEPVVTEILRAEGIPASRHNYARVFLNEKFIGVYGNVERIDESFVETHFPGKKAHSTRYTCPAPAPC